MTAIGFALFVVGAILFALYDDNAVPRPRLAEALITSCVVIGMLLFIGGATVWLWHNMP